VGPSNISAPPRRDPALDGLRGLAVLMVFLFHYGGGLRSHNPFVHSIGMLTGAGWIGVVLFFSLSGFFITGGLWDSLANPLPQPNLHSKVSPNPRILLNFYIRRALRILPLYYTVILLCGIGAFARGTSFADIRTFFADFMFFLQDIPYLNARAILNPSPLPLYHLWSLAVEEQFYLLWPFLLLLVVDHKGHPRRQAMQASLWIFSFSCIFRLLIWGLPVFASVREGKAFEPFLFTHVGALALGSALALALRTTKPGRPSTSARFVHRHADAAFYLGFLLFLVSSFLAKSPYLNAPIQFMLGLPAISLAGTAVIPILIRPGFARHLLSFSLLGWLGRISYGFYIFHILLQPLYDSLGAHLTHASSGSRYQLVRLLVALPMTTLAAWVSFHFLEKPFLHKQRSFPMRPALPISIDPR
jgi:peptidoglycan/LPS O-acetylase OafA/YrhL